MSSSHFIYAVAYFSNISMAEFHPLYISLLVSDRVDALQAYSVVPKDLYI